MIKMLMADGCSVGDVRIPFSSVVKTLGVYFDSDLSFEKHISHVVKLCYCHIRSLSRARPSLTRSAANAIAVTLIMSRLDYCNSLLSGLPLKQTRRLQAVQNAAARVVAKSKVSDHISPVLSKLHWLPVQSRITHKLLSLTYQSACLSIPSYLSDLIQHHNPSRPLRSASKPLLDVPGPRECKTKRYGERAFRYAAPSQWNALPEDIRRSDSLSDLKKNLKTYFFKKAQKI